MNVRERGQNHDERRKYARQESRVIKRSVESRLTAASIPEGSILTEDTLAAIEAGQYVVRRRLLPRTSPVISQKPRLQRRRRIAKLSRRTNRHR